MQVTTTKLAFFFLCIKTRSMHLRSGIFYRSGHSNRVDRQSGISTQESTARTPNQATPIAEERTDSETESNSSMDTSSSVPMRTQGIELEYDATLRFRMTNAHGARIYRDFINRFAVREEDHSSLVSILRHVYITKGIGIWTIMELCIS